MANYDELFKGEQKNNAKESFVPFDRDEWIAAKQKERDETFALAEKTLGEVAKSPEMFKAFLDVQARFDRYSVNNALLVTAQMPSATRLADFDTWKKNDVYVKKGAEGIRIIGPGEEYLKSDGSTGVRFNTKKVFDISQTNSTPKNDRRDLNPKELIKAIISNAPCKLVMTDELEGNVSASYSLTDKTIFIRGGMEADQIIKSLSQQFAHAKLDSNDHPHKENSFTAYCVSYIVAKRLGIDTASFDFSRAASEFNGKDASDIRKQLNAIKTASGEITAGINKYLEEQRSSRRRDDAR